MRDKSGIVMLFITSLLCICVIVFGAFYITDDEIIERKQKINEYYINTPSSISSESTGEQGKAQEVIAQGTVLGKISEQFISPYGANTSYNRVYIKNKVGIDLDIPSLLSSKNPVKITKNSEPQVLIMHTHTTECYLKETRDYYTDTDLTRTRDTSYNMVAIGEIFTKKLNNAGIVTIHDTTEHDYPAYNGSYTRSAETVKKYLQKYPSIKVVIDLHRDSIGGTNSNRVKPIVEINGKKTAQVMLVMGCGEKIGGYDNWKQNLTFAIKYQQTLEVLYPGLCRATSFVSSRYNQNLTTGSILLEVGTESNSFEEASRAAEYASNALISYLNTLS